MARLLNTVKHDFQIKLQESDTLRKELSAKDDLIKQMKEKDKTNEVIMTNVEAGYKQQLAELEKQLEGKRERFEKLQSDHDQLKMETKSFDRILQQKEEMETLLAATISENEAMKIKVDEQTRNFEAIQENIQNEGDYKAKYEALKEQIEPFKKQLEEFELEKEALMKQKNFTENQLGALTAEHAKKLGHQNHAQKIQYLVKIKTENAKLQKENVKLQTELTKKEKITSKLEAKIKEMEVKENSTPLTRKPSLKKSTLEAPEKQSRRNTLAPSSPLATRNRK